MRMRATIAIAALLAAGDWVLAQTPAGRVALPRTESREFVSAINNRAYQVLVSLPQSYSQNATARFPVIYLTDANWTFAITAQSHYLLRFGAMAPDAIIVGIVRTGVDDDPRDGNTAGAERTFDLTPTRVPEEERDRAKEYLREVKSGGAPEFLRVFREELIPDIERRYRTTGDRTYIGYSLGGLFGAYALFQAPEVFQRMILVSPSLMWDDHVLFKQEQAFSSSHKALPVRLFMSVGEFETPDMVSSMRIMANTLAGRHYQGLEVSTRIFEGERHLATFPVAVTRGLRTVFGDASQP